MNKKNRKIWSPSPPEHFEILVQKPPMLERVYARILRNHIIKEPWHQMVYSVIGAEILKMRLQPSNQFLIRIRVLRRVGSGPDFFTFNINCLF